MQINNRLIGILASAAGLLLVPFIAMQFSDQVKWGAFDFLVAAVLLFGFGLLIEMVLRKIKKTGHRVLVCCGLLLVLVLIWAELAVGILGTPLAGS